MSDGARLAAFQVIAGNVDSAAELLKLLGNPQRLMISCLLAEGAFAVSAIEARLGIRQPSLSQQLGALREAGLIEGRREAKAVIYQLKDQRIRCLLGALQDIFCPDEGSRADNGGQRSGAASTGAASTGAAGFGMAGVAAFARLGAARNG